MVRLLYEKYLKFTKVVICNYYELPESIVNTQLANHPRLNNAFLVAFLTTNCALLFDRKVSKTAFRSLLIFWFSTGQAARVWCGDGANPPGIFFSFILDINPFRNIPIVGDWIFSSNTEIYAFVTTEENISVATNIDIVNDILDVKGIVSRLKSFINEYINKFIGVISEAIQAVLTALQTILNELEDKLQDVLSKNGDLKHVLKSMKAVWKKLDSLRGIKTNLTDRLEFYSDELSRNLTNLIEYETGRVEQNIGMTLKKIQEKVMSLAKRITGAGFRFSSHITVIGLEFSVMEVELVYSVNALGQCNKFKKVYSLLEGEKAFRLSLHAAFPIRLYYFITLDANVFISLAVGSRDKFVLHCHVQASFLGLVSAGADMLISNRGLYLSVEGNIWNVFFARIEASAELGEKWYKLVFKLKGRLLAASESDRIKKESDFTGSYLDGLRVFAKKIGTSANERLTAAQNGLSAAQHALTKAQGKLTDAQEYLRGCNSKFDRAIEKLERAKDKLEQAKGPFERALEKLRKAQRNVDKLCRIRSCSPKCVPGIRCRMCKKRWARYPCCRKSRCMFKVPNLPCLAANALCRGVRAVAYAALEAAKLFVRAPMLIFDAAKAALSLAQIAVDKARVILKVAEGLLEVAKIGLETMKGGLEIAKRGLELIKKTLDAAIYVFNLIIKYGLQNLIDVRNCGFEVEIAVHDKALVEVFCDVKAFGLGWTTIRFWFDFRHPLTSMLNIAKSTVKRLLKSVKKLFGKRKRRDISFMAMSHLHKILELYKRDVSSNSSMYLEDSVFRQNNLTNENPDTVEYENRVLMFRQNCGTFQNAYSFLMTSIEVLVNMTADTVQMLNDFHQNNDTQNTIANFNISNMTIESAGISPEYALKDYNITEEELNSILENFKDNFTSDPIYNEIEAVEKEANDISHMSVNQAENLPLIEHWFNAMENETSDYFNESQCHDFSDCTLYAFSVLNDLLSDDSLDNSDANQNLLKTIEDNYLQLNVNSSLTVTEIYQTGIDIIENLTKLENGTMFCSTAPSFTTTISNVTVFAGSDIKLVCDVTGDPYPEIRWYCNDTLMENITDRELIMLDSRKVFSGAYKCVAENIVARLPSSVAFVRVIGRSIWHKVLFIDI